MRNQTSGLVGTQGLAYATSQRKGTTLEDWSLTPSGYVRFRQIDRADMMSNAAEALLPPQADAHDRGLFELADYRHNSIGGSKNKTKKSRRCYSSRRNPKDIYKGENWTLKFKMVHADSKIVKAILQAHEFEEIQGHDWNILWTNSIGKPYLYTGLNEYQKVNHFPSSYEITRKNNFANNVHTMITQFGRKEFEIIPETYVLPGEFGNFFDSFKKRENNEKTTENIWIVKANALSRGRGIYLVNDPAQVNMESPCVVSKYISNPLLINNHKFDLRLYVLVTSFNPLRIYLYKEGLARFCSEKYNLDKSLKNKFMHLTNYSINKKNAKFIKNTNDEDDGYGSKWSLTALIKHLDSIGCDTSKLWKRITDIIIKSIISGEKHISSAVKRNLEHRGTCFELFGFDVLIDSNYKPWVMEINLSPSLACDAPLDFKIKSKLIYETLNLVGIKQFDRKEEARKKIKSRTRAGLNHLTKGPQFSQLPTPAQILKAPIEIFGSGFLNKDEIHTRSMADTEKLSIDEETRGIINDMVENNLKLSEGQIYDIFKKVSHKKKEVLRDTIMENQRMGDFTRIFPSKGTDKYFKFFSNQNNSNKLTYDFLYNIKQQEEEKETSATNMGINNFFEPQIEDSVFCNTNKHFLDLEAKLRPLKQRPDSAANAMRYRGISINDSNMSTRSSTKPNESISSINGPVKKKSTEDILIDYFQGILDNIKNQFVFFKDKDAPVINFEQLEGLKTMNMPISSIINQTHKARKRARSSYGRNKRSNTQSSQAYSTYLVQKFDSLSKYFSMTVKDLMNDKHEQGILSNSLIAMINRLRLVKPRVEKRRNSRTNFNLSVHDSFSGKQPIPAIGRMRRVNYNGIPRPNRALTAKYRPVKTQKSFRPPTAGMASKKFLPPRPSAKKYSKPRMNSASENKFLGPIVTKLAGSQSRLL
ncbi:unnamed protein product [Moneuplotes crassus]|uniref:Tubulin--tyrosine ligase-like protein 5 n=1 Tax=Euplotes crassus TaxID=5936 RepID=A0AAD2D6R9_EUPCR|nr:unnamed protein product [Moneuplotes crassus]